MGIDITLSNNDTDGFFNTIRDAVRAGDLDTLLKLRETVALASKMEQIGITETECFKIHIICAELHVKLNKKEEEK